MTRLMALASSPLERSPARPALAVEDLSKAYGHGRNAVVALRGVTLRLDPGEFVCLVGASGSGKTTLLSLLAGLETPTSGSIDTGAARRALLFQDAALMPWLSASANVELPLQIQRVSRAERGARVAELLALVGLADFADRRPHELSGGMRQRVALARALAEDADLLLMDEPFGGLDAITRDVLHDEVERIWLRRRPTVLFVTHNAREAVRLGDRVLVFSSRPGRIAAELAVDLPRPRRTDSPEVATRAAEIGDRLREEVRLHGR